MISAEKRAQIVALVRAGRSKNSLAQEFGVVGSTIGRWMKEAEPERVSTLRKLGEHHDEIVRMLSDDPSLTAHDVGKRFGVSATNAHRYLKHHKIPYAYKRPSNDGARAYLAEGSARAEARKRVPVRA